MLAKRRPHLAKKRPHLAKKRPHLAKKRPHLAKKLPFLLMLSLLWQVLSQEGDSEGDRGVGPSQEAPDHRGYAGGGTGACLGGGGLGGRGWFFFLGGGGGAGRPGGVGTWRYVSTTGIWTNPMRTVRSKKRVHGQKSWHKRDATWRKGDPTWRKSDNVGEKVDFIGAKKYIVL